MRAFTLKGAQWNGTIRFASSATLAASMRRCWLQPTTSSTVFFQTVLPVYLFIHTGSRLVRASTETLESYGKRFILDAFNTDEQLFKFTNLGNLVDVKCYQDGLSLVWHLAFNFLFLLLHRPYWLFFCTFTNNQQLLNNPSAKTATLQSAVILERPQWISQTSIINAKCNRNSQKQKKENVSQYVHWRVRWCFCSSGARRVFTMRR